MMGYTILNFSHPLTDAHMPQIQAALKVLDAPLGRQYYENPVDQVIDMPIQLDLHAPIVPQVIKAIDTVATTHDISGIIWQAASFIVNLPGLAPASAAILAELHGRIGHFPLIMRLAQTAPGQFGVVEIIDLQASRDDARTRRHRT